MGAEIAFGYVGLVALVWKFVDFLRLLANFATQKSAVITQITAWVGGIIGVFLYASTGFAANTKIGDTMLDKYNGTSLIVIGLMIASTASALVDFKQARDATDSAAKPRLLK